MDSAVRRRALRGRSVLIAHEDAFHRRYLADVLEASGAAVTGTQRDPAAARAHLAAGPPLDTLVLSPLLPHGEADDLAAVAVRRGVAVLVVEPVRRGSAATLPADAVLSAPYAGFQVVDAVAALLAGRDPAAPAPAPSLPRALR